MLRAMLAALLVMIVLAGTAPAGDPLDARSSAEPYLIAQAAPADRPAGIAPDTIVERDPRGRGIAFSGTIGGRSDEWRWVRARRGEVPDGAFVAGFEPGAEHYVCRGEYKGSVLPGNLIAGENACSIGHRGREVRTKTYEVLTGTEDEFAWVAAARGIDIH